MNQLPSTVRCLGFTTLCLAATLLRAQTVVAPMPASTVVPVNDPNKPAARSTAPSSSILSAFVAGMPLWQRGPMALRPHFVYRLVYGEGLRNAGVLESGDSIIHSIAIGTLAELGTHWTADYTLTRTIYSSQYFTDDTAHNFNLAGGYSYNDWRGGLSYVYEQGSPTLVETASQTEQRTHTAEGTLSKAIGQRSLIALSGGRSAHYVQAPARSPQWATSNSISWFGTAAFHYFLVQELDVSSSFSAGYDQVSSGADMSFTRPQFTLRWRPSPRVSASVDYGREIRHFNTANSESLTSPIYSGAVQYQVFETTSLSFNASRRLGASSFANQATRSDDRRISLDQRLLGRFFLTASASTFTSRYYASGSGVRTNRKDDGTTLDFRVSTAVLKRGSVAVFYHVARNRSNVFDFGFASHQVGSEFSYRF